MTGPYEWLAMSQWLKENPGRDFREEGWEMVGGALRRPKRSDHEKTTDTSRAGL